MFVGMLKLLRWLPGGLSEALTVLSMKPTLRGKIKADLS